MAMGGGASEEELKRSTDCVYFLASPLTCKKGSECEYRHSESARLNPKDCWYWQSGSCLNPKCPFRHPPLEGLTGTSSGSAPASTQALAPTQITPAHGPSYNSIKQSAPCYYFQQGFCLKGNRCPFMHGPSPTGNPPLQHVGKGSPPTTEPSQMLKKDSWGFKECNSQQNIFKVPAANIPPAARKSASRTETEPNNGPSNLVALHQHKLARSPPVHASLGGGNAESGLFNHQVQPVDEHPHNGREADEFLAESSPGFDVLVEDDVEDTYFPNEDEFGIASAPDGRRMNTVNGFDYHHSDYEAVPQYEIDRYDGMGEYDRYVPSRQHLGSEPHRGSSKRVADRQLTHERVREKNLDQIDGSDLRHQLKRKRLNGSRSAISPDRRARPYWRDGHHAEERDRDCTKERYHHDHRDQLRFPSERPISTRLQGRITLPRRTSPVKPTDHRSDREIDRARHLGRSSPPQPINYHRRRHLQDRIKRRPDEDFATDARNSGGQAINKDDSDSLDFAGPKSLAELKVAKALKRSQEQPVDSFNVIATAEQKTVTDTTTISQESAGSKPLSIMLESEAPQGDAVVSNTSENGISEPVASSHFHSIHSIEEASKDSESVPRTAEKGVPTPVEVDHLQVEEGAAAENVDEDHDLENGYDDVEGDTFKAEDDEYVYQEDEEELDEDDDFARKVGSMFS